MNMHELLIVSALDMILWMLNISFCKVGHGKKEISIKKFIKEALKLREIDLKTCKLVFMSWRIFNYFHIG